MARPEWSGICTNCIEAEDEVRLGCDVYINARLGTAMTHSTSIVRTSSNHRTCAALFNSHHTAPHRSIPTRVFQSHIPQALPASRSCSLPRCPALRKLRQHKATSPHLAFRFAPKYRCDVFPHQTEQERGEACAQPPVRVGVAPAQEGAHLISD